MSRYYLWTIGCQMNAADAARTRHGLESMGFSRTTNPPDADVLVLITCVVRQRAEDRVIGHLSSLKSPRLRNAGALLIVMGCFVDDQCALHVRFPYVDALLQPSDVEGLLRVVELRSSIAAPRARPVATPERVVSALVPVSEGCDHQCTYCIVRLRRGQQCSRPLPDIVEEVQDWVERGAREVTLLGQNVDAYGRDWEPPAADLADVLRSVHSIEGLMRIRFLTSHPGDMTSRVVQAVADLPRVCPHFELPVQSGHDVVLRRMGRRYTIAAYRALIADIRQRVPGCSIVTDVIVGFPGETAAQFQATYDLLSELRFDAVHIAKYSARPGTPAAQLDDDVPSGEKERRRSLLEELQARIAGDVNAAILHSNVEVLVEGRRRGRWMGRTETNKLVFFEDTADRRGQLVDVRVLWTGPWSLVGEPADCRRNSVTGELE
jgi:tRNA-2-methylthio-N6-dimethylallyladenosine synthase